MLPCVINALVDGIKALGSLQNENAATTALATALHAAGARSFWTAKSIWPCLPNATRKPSFKGSKAYDLSWARAPAAVMPDHFLQVKLGNKDQEDQEVLLFLGDLAFAALDYVGPQSSIACAAVIPADRPTTYWQRLAPVQGQQMTLMLRPATAADGIARGANWINPVARCIAPTTRSQYSKIFGAGTNAKFVGLFHRQGEVSIESQVSLHEAGRYRLLIYEVGGLPSFTGPGSLQQWWP